MVRIKQILCPTDFSECSRHAFDGAVGMARSYDATVNVLHILPVPSAVPAVPYGPEGPGPFHAEVPDKQRVLSELPRFLALEHSIGVAIEYHVTQAASVQKEILAHAARLSADLIVLGTHGRSGFERLVLGSVTEKVLRTSYVPVLTVPSGVPDVVPAGRGPFRRILYATDFSTGSESALRYAASLAQHGAAQLTLLHVVEAMPVAPDPTFGLSFDVAAYEAALVQSARKRLGDWVPEALRLGCDTEDMVVRGKPYAEILRVASERESDLIVLGVRGRGTLDRLVFGSTAEHLVRRATCPVLTVRDDRPEA